MRVYDIGFVLRTLIKKLNKINKEVRIEWQIFQFCVPLNECGNM